MKISAFVYFSMLCAFIPFSISTPAGFLSPVDAAIGFLFVGVIARGLHQRSMKLSNPRALFVGLLGYIIFTVVQLRSGIAGASLYIKYLEFLVLIPLAFSLSGISVGVHLKLRTISRVLIVGGFLLFLISFTSSIVHGKGPNGDFNLQFLGNKFNKNGVGALLLFSIGASSFTWVSEGKWTYFMAALVQVVFLVYLESRSSALSGLLSMAIFYFAYRGWGRGLSLVLSVSLVVLLLGSFLATTPLGTYYLERYRVLFSFDTSTVNSSNSRLLLWEYAVLKIPERPLLGHGYGEYSYSGSVHWLSGMYEPHNSILQILYSGGVVSLLLYFALIPLMLWRSKGRYGLLFLLPIIYLINSLVGIIFLRNEGHILMILLSISAFCIRFSQHPAEMEHSIRRVPQQTIKSCDLRRPPNAE